MFIKRIMAKRITDSRGDPTIEISVNGMSASSPSGKSKGKYETSPFRKSIEWNINFLNSFHPTIQIKSFLDLREIEKTISKKAKLKDVKQFGANALFAFESAILKALAASQKKQLWQVLPNSSSKNIPTPVGNCVGGGLHSHNKSHPSFQEFLLIPEGDSAKENVKIMQTIYSRTKQILKSNSKNDEGAWQTNLDDEAVLEALVKNKKIRIGVDVASSSFYKNAEYFYKNKTLDKNSQIFFINYLIKKFNLLYIEDPLQERDFDGFSKIHRDEKRMVVGDDLTATQIHRLKKAVSKKSINAMIIKPNQNGSLIELAEIFNICKKNNIKTIMSHRSGETMDSSLADYAVGFAADYIKCGISTKWREVKLKRLIDIEKTKTFKSPNFIYSHAKEERINRREAEGSCF